MYTLIFDLDGTLVDSAPGIFGVLWGYGTKAELPDSGADALIEQPEQLADAFRCA